MEPRQSNAPHRVELTFEEGYSVSAKLICPDEGCEQATACGSCGRNFDDSETEPCYDCREAQPDGCWVRSWFDNCTADELLSGTLTVEITAHFDGDSCVAEIVRAVEPVEAK